MKAGPNTLNLSNSNTYSGGTTINGGVLMASNTAGSATGSGLVTINGGTLSSGPHGGTVAGSVTAGSGPHVIATGLGVGTGGGNLTIGGNLNLNANSTLAFDFTGDTPDLMAIDGGMYLTDSGPVNVDINGTLSDHSYTLADFLGTTMNASNFNLVGERGYFVQVNNNSLQIVAVPEPSTFALLAVGACGLLVYVRRRRAS